MEGIRDNFRMMQEQCPPDAITSFCRESLSKLDSELQKAAVSAAAHERRGKLIDDMYYTVGSKLNSTFDLDQLLGVIIDSLEKLISFDAAGIFLVDRQSGEIEAEYIRGYRKEFFGRIHQKVGEGVLGWVIEKAQSANVPDVSLDARYIYARPETRSETATPLMSKGEVIGCINLESDHLAAFSEEDTALLETYATQAALAVERAKLLNELWARKWLEEEIALARKIQLSLLPSGPPEIPGFKLAGMNQPSRGIGGDYFDYIPLPSGGMGLTIADVAGKGIGAALIMSGFRAALRSESWHNPNPEKLMRKVNRFVYESTVDSVFVTAFFGILNGSSFQYVNAGHFPPVLIHQDCSHELLSAGGMLLGVFEEQEYESAALDIRPGDTIVFFTDGVTEALNRREDEYGVDRLIDTIKEFKSSDAEDKIRRLRGSVLAFTGGLPPADDLTVMILDCTSS